MNNKVTVVIPCYNDGQYLTVCIDSVENQDYKNFSIVIVNDGSTDESTLKMLDSLRKKYKVIDIENGGPGKARNSGIKEADSEYILTLDADDKIAPDYLSKTVDALDKSSSDIAFINTDWEVFGLESKVVKKKDYDLADLAWENIVGNNCLFRRQVWEEVSGYSTNLNGIEDWDFWIKVVARGYKWEYLPYPLMKYRKRLGSLSANNGKRITELGTILLENNKDFFIKNYIQIYLKGNERWYREFSKNISN